MRSIKGVIDAKGDVKTVVASAAKLKQLENAFDKMFPAGSDKGETKALPAVWSDMPGFQAASKNADAPTTSSPSRPARAISRPSRRLRRHRQGVRRLPRQVPRQGQLSSGIRANEGGGNAAFFVRPKGKAGRLGTTGLLGARGWVGG
jgi:hypothetical protein